MAAVLAAFAFARGTVLVSEITIAPVTLQIWVLLLEAPDLEKHQRVQECPVYCFSVAAARRRTLVEVRRNW